MLRLVLCVIYIILKVKGSLADAGTENPVVRLCYRNDGNKNYTVWKGKPLKIIIEDGYPRYVFRCRASYAESKHIPDFIPTTPFNNSGIAILDVKNVTAEMSTRWSCTVLTNYETLGTPFYTYQEKKYTAKDLFFNLYVRGAKAVILSANKRSLTYVTTNQTVNYDGEANFTYVEGEDLEISCEKAEVDLGITSTVRLEYYNAAGLLLFETKSREKTPHRFRTVLKSDNNNYYLECIHATEYPRREYRYRTTFLKKKGSLQAGANQHEIILYVNGQELTTMSIRDPSYDDYNFRYLITSKLNVTCRKKDPTKQGTLTFHSDKKFENTHTFDIHRSETGTVISVELSTATLTNKTLTCSINNTDMLKPNARILFLEDELTFDVYVEGLTTNNILYQYTNYDKQSTIEYQYSVNESLNLTCVSNIGFKVSSSNMPKPADADVFQWKFEGKPYNYTAVSVSRKPSMKWTQKTFTKTLDATYNTKKLQCIYFPNGMIQYGSKSVELIFRLKPEIVAETNKVQSPPDEDSKPQIIYIAVSVGAAIGIITMICLFLWRKRIKRTHLIQTEYDNLSNQNDSPIPAFPNQWESNYEDSNYARIDEGVMEENDTYTTDTDKLYRMPNKRQSNTSENHYTEIDDIVRPKPVGIPVNWNSTHPYNLNKTKDPFKETPPHKSNHFFDSKQGIYDNLRHDNSPIYKSNETYSNVQKTGKSKTVTFRQMSNDLRSPRKYSEGTSQQHCENDGRFKQNSDGHYVNGNQDIYMQPGDSQKKPNYENHLFQNERSANNVYAEPYGDLGISSKNEYKG